MNRVHHCDIIARTRRRVLTAIVTSQLSIMTVHAGGGVYVLLSCFEAVSDGGGGVTVHTYLLPSV